MRRNGESWCVVHSVTHHHDGAFGFHLADYFQFVRREQFGPDFVNLGLTGDGLSDQSLVARQHNHLFHS